jgi:hypothetical protein
VPISMGRFHLMSAGLDVPIDIETRHPYPYPYGEGVPERDACPAVAARLQLSEVTCAAGGRAVRLGR